MLACNFSSFTFKESQYHTFCQVVLINKYKFIFVTGSGITNCRAGWSLIINFPFIYEKNHTQYFMIDSNRFHTSKVHIS